jgi:hypothetical protein
MDEQQKMERLRKLVLEERMENFLPVWWYLSFAAPEGWQGGCVVLGHGFVTALLEAKRIGINAHGQVTGHPVPRENIPAPKWRNRLLTKEQFESFWGPMVRFSTDEVEEMGVERKDIDGDIFEN